jgi:hypothetical protein
MHTHRHTNTHTHKHNNAHTHTHKHTHTHMHRNFRKELITAHGVRKRNITKAMVPKVRNFVHRWAEVQ